MMKQVHTVDLEELFTNVSDILPFVERDLALFSKSIVAPLLSSSLHPAHSPHGPVSP